MSDKTQPTSRAEITVFGTNIRKDAEGRFSLNDLHKAAMAKGHATESQRPGNFLKTDILKVFIKTLNSKTTIQCVKKNTGATGSSFACAEVFIKYAQWLSPKIGVEVSNLFNLPSVVMDYVRREFLFGEEIVYNLFKGYNVIKQFNVLGGKYKIDWYIPELQLAIEFDEAHHSTPANQEADKARQQEIEKVLGCRFLRYTDK